MQGHNKDPEQKPLSRQQPSVNYCDKNSDNKRNHQIAEEKQFQLEIFGPQSQNLFIPQTLLLRNGSGVVAATSEVILESMLLN